MRKFITSNSYKIEVLWRVSLVIFVTSWCLESISTMHLFGLSYEYKIPDIIVNILLAIIGMKGLDSILQGRKAAGSKPAAVKERLCEYPELPECPLKYIDSQVRSKDVKE